MHSAQNSVDVNAATFAITIKKQDLLTPLLTISGAVDKKPNSAILGHILLTYTSNNLKIIATDLDIEMTASIPCQAHTENGSIVLSAKKLMDIMRSLDDDACPELHLKENGLQIKSGRSQFKLTTLPSTMYPSTKDIDSDKPLTINRLEFMQLLQATCFAISLQDVRNYLNGLLLEIDAQYITTVAADGHRMAIGRLPHNHQYTHYRLLIPRKGIQELLRLLQQVNEETVLLSVGTRHIKITTKNYTFSSKLIAARFPPYHNAIPTKSDKTVLVERDQLKRALTRIIILANEKSYGVLLHIQPQQLTLLTKNQEQEEAIESLTVMTTGDELKIGINANYLLDVINHITDGALLLSFISTNDSILLESSTQMNYQYIIMPMKI